MPVVQFIVQATVKPRFNPVFVIPNSDRLFGTIRAVKVMHLHGFGGATGPVSVAVTSEPTEHVAETSSAP